MANGNDPDPDPEPESNITGENPPPDPTTTETPPPSGTDDTVTGDIHQDDEYTKQLQNQYKTDTFNLMQHHNQQQQYINQIQQQMADLQNTPQPQMLSQRPPPSNEDKTTVTQNVMQLLAIAGIAFSVFGARRNSYSQGALMGGMGALLQGYAQGRAKRQKENLVNWHKLNEDVQHENAARRKEYEGILANKKLNLQEQMQLIRMKGEFYNSNRMSMNAQKNDLAAIQKHIRDMKKAEATHAANTPKMDQDHRRWNELAKERYRSETGKTPQGDDWVHTPEGAEWTLQHYPFSEFLNQEKSVTRYNKKGEVVGRSRGGFTGKDDEPDPKKDDPLGLFGGVKPKAKSSTNPKSVLGGGDTEPW